MGEAAAVAEVEGEPGGWGEEKEREGVEPGHAQGAEGNHGDTAKVIGQLLMLEGHTVEQAGDVATALELVHRHQFDLLISDLGLPDRSGLDLIRELRACGSTLPAIALSGYGQEEDIHRSRQAGFATHLTKPTRPARLVEAVAAVTAARGGDRPL